MATLTESKCQALRSQHTSPLPGSSTRTATAETRPRRAAWISPASLVASAGWEDDLQATSASQGGSAPGARAAGPAAARARGRWWDG